MRTLSSALQTAQASLNRKPNTRIILRDVMHRFYTHATGGFSSYYPATTYNSVPWCPIDMNIDSYGVMRVWCSQTGWAYQSRLSTLSGDWTGGYTWSGLFNGYMDKPHRMSVVPDQRCFHGDTGDIRYFTISSGGVKSGGVWKSSAFTSTDRVAFAAVDKYTVYMAEYHPNTDFGYIELQRLEDTDLDNICESTKTCPHTIIVDSSYKKESLTWFDAETLGSRDVIILNEAAFGKPVVVFYEDGVWSDPRPLMPMDLVDQYSFLRISHVAKIQDSGSDDVLWATGRIGFKGSSGSYPQEYDVVLRTKDGEHWSIDRYSYVCSTQMRGKFLVDTNYTYYPEGATVKRTLRTWLMGSDQSLVKHTLTDDILGWGYNQNEAGSPSTGRAAIADHNGKYTPKQFDASDHRWETQAGNLAIHAGMWLWRYVGYSGEEVLLSTEAIDSVPPQYRAGNRQLSLSTRDLVMRLLTDWTSVQDWQWLSEQKHYDDCDKLDYLYSVGAAQITVRDEDDAELEGKVMQTELTESDNEPTLLFDALNREGIFLTTSPFEARNFTVRAHFQYDHDATADTPTGLGHNLKVDTNQGTLSYGSDGNPYFTDSGQDFWKWACASSSEESSYIIVVTNSDSTVSWAYLMELQDTTNKDDVYVATVPDGSVTGWNGTSITGKTPSSYYIARADEYKRIGTGFGVVGCAVDQYNLVAGFFGIAEGTSTNTLYLLAKHGNKDASQWFILGQTSINITLSKNKIYEVELRRNGAKIAAYLTEFVNTGTDVTRTERGSVVKTWFLPHRMVNNATDEDDDNAKVGVIINQSVPEAQIHRCAADQDTVALDPDIFDRPFEYTYDSNVYKAYYTNQFDHNEWDYDSLGVAPLHFGGEVWQAEAMDFSQAAHLWKVLKMTAANMRTPELYMDGHDWGTRQVAGAPTSEESCYAPYRPDGVPSGSFANQQPWAMIVTRDFGKGVHSAMNACTESGQTVYGVPQPFYTDPGPPEEDIYYFGFMTTEEWDRIEVNEEPGGDREDRWVMSPCFFLSGRKGWEGAQAHSTGTKLRQHWNPTITLHSVWAYDREFDKTREWVLKDIASKAGVLDFETRLSIDENTQLPRFDTGSGPTWYGTKIKNFDVTMTLPNKLTSGQSIGIIFRSTSNAQLFSSNAWTNLDGASAVYAYYYINGSGYPEIGLRQTNTTGDNKSDWVDVERYTLASSMNGKRIRWVLHNNFLTVYVNDCRTRTMRFGPIFGIDNDGYSAACEKPGWMGYFSSGVTVTVDIEQPEMWAWTDGIILDQRMSAVAGMQRAIQNQRVKFFSRPDASLFMSYLATRSDVGTIDDEIVVDIAGQTDRIPTHIRMSGEEESDYVNHSAAELYGVIFALAQAPYLDEPEAYAEAQRIVKDAVSHSRAHKLEGRALLEVEIEDECEIHYTPHDGGPVVWDDYIFSSVQYSFSPGSLTMTATLREKQ